MAPTSESMDTNLFQCPLSLLLFPTRCFFWRSASSNFCFERHGLHLPPLFHSFFLGPWRWSKASFSKPQIGLTKKKKKTLSLLLWFVVMTQNLNNFYFGKGKTLQFEILLSFPLLVTWAVLLVFSLTEQKMMLFCCIISSPPFLPWETCAVHL